MSTTARSSGVALVVSTGCALSLACSPAPAVAFVDLELDSDRIENSVVIDYDVFHPPGSRVDLDQVAPVSGNCVLDPSEACVGGPGVRKLLRFDVLVHNRGDEDLIVGNPREHLDLFDYSACHGHYHFRGSANYELVDGTGNVVAPGRKQGFCMEDTAPSSASTTWPRRYNCANQGIQVGYADLYPAELDCQWIDITDVPAGDYRLRVSWNPNRLLSETRFDNNVAIHPLTLEPAESAAPVIERIVRPSSGWVLSAGRASTVAWRAHDDREIVSQEVWLSTDDGQTYRQIVGDLPGNARQYALQVPLDAASGAARIKIVARDAETSKGERVSARFRISPRHGRLPVLR